MREHFFDEKNDEYRVTLYSTTFQHSCCCFELALGIRPAFMLLPRAKETHSDLLLFKFRRSKNLIVKKGHIL